MPRPYRDRVVFERLTVGPDDGAGNQVQSWAPFHECACDLVPVRGGEEVLAGKLAGTMSYSLELWSGAVARTITTADRVTIVRSRQFSTATDAAGQPWRLNIASPPEDADRRGVSLSMLVQRGKAVG